MSLSSHNPLFLAAVEIARASIKEISIEEFIVETNAAAEKVVLDVREKHEYDAGHFTSAIHCGKGVLERDIESHNIAMDATIICYCGGGFRSALAAQSLQSMGYSNVSSLWGGWQAIKDASLPTAGSASADMVHVIAVITCKPSMRDAVLAIFNANVPAVKAEEGCIEYGATVDYTVAPVPAFMTPWGEHAFVVVEKWASMAHLDAHGAAPHMAAYGKATAEMTAGKAIYIMSNASV